MPHDYRNPRVGDPRACSIRLIALPLLAIGLPSMTSAQECESDRAANHASWHARELALRAFEDTLKGLLLEAGASPIGGISIGRQLETGEIEVEPRMLSVPPAADERFRMARDAFVAAAELAPGEEVSLDLGQPRPPLWNDRTERCEAVLDNVAEVGGLVAQVVMGAISQEKKARPGGRIRIDLWTRVDWTGRVGAMELREEGGQWGWLAPYLQALAPVMRYRPATLNGAPQTIWMSQPFELEF